MSQSVEIGVDIEKIKNSMDYLNIAKRFFHPDEYSTLLQITNLQQQQRAFFVLWTAKEALLKATGEGIAAGLSSFSIQQDTFNPLVFNHNYSSNITLTSLQAPNNYVATLAIVGENKPILYRELSIL